MPGYPILVPEAYINVLVAGNIDSDKTLELAYPTFSKNDHATVAIKLDGSIVARFPSERDGYALLGNLSSDFPGLEIFANGPDVASSGGISQYKTFVAYTGAGNPLPKWPNIKIPTSSDSSFPLLADLNGDGVDEILLPNTLPKKVDGTDLFGHNGFSSPLAVGDIDGDGKPDILSAGNSTPLEAVHSDGTVFGTFVPRDPAYYYSLLPVSHVLGDFYGDGKAETLIVAAELNKDPLTTPRHLEIWSADGKIKAKIYPISNSSEDLQAFTNSVIALGDLNCDGLPEIVDQTPNNLFVWKADGTLLPGWPQPLENKTNASPVIGDVVGDGYADIVTVDNYHLLKAFDRHGNLLPGFPKQFDKGIDVTPVIADFFGDGRNEIAVISDDPGASPLTDANGQPQSRLWLYDLHGKGPFGPVQWGQFRGGPEYQGYYKPQPQPCKP